jgi:hypothetical protein
LKGLDLVAADLQNPFGDDANDLPTLEMHHEMNRLLTLLLNPRTQRVPRLLPTALNTYNDLNDVNDKNRAKLDMASRSKSRLSMGRTASCEAKAEIQRNWSKQFWPNNSDRMSYALGLGRNASVSTQAVFPARSARRYSTGLLFDLPEARSVHGAPSSSSSLELGEGSICGSDVSHVSTESPTHGESLCFPHGPNLDHNSEQHPGIEDVPQESSLPSLLTGTKKYCGPADVPHTDLNAIDFLQTSAVGENKDFFVESTEFKNDKMQSSNTREIV